MGWYLSHISSVILTSDYHRLFFILLQLLTVLEGAIRPDCLSSDFETSECLNSQVGSASVLPWVPDTTSAVMLRMLDLDSAILYVQNQKMDRDDGGFMVSLILIILFFLCWKYGMAVVGLTHAIRLIASCFGQNLPHCSANTLSNREMFLRV
jgi:hypothetical protein